jgi:hypothetical protein
MYYELSPQVIRLLMLDPILLWRTHRGLDRYEPVIESLVRDGRVAVAPQDLDEVEAYLTTLESRSGPRLADTIRALKRDVRDPQARAELGIELREGSRRRAVVK